MNRRILSILAAVSLTSAGLAGCSSSDTVVGTWGEDREGQPSLTFEEDGKVSGTDGCNRLTSSWTQDGKDISFSPVASTMMACPDVDAWLSGLDSATLDGDTLTILGADGETLGTLERAAD